MLNVAFGQSKYYSDNLSENVKRGIRHKIGRGEWTGKAPLGYLNNPKTRNIEPDNIKAKIVRKIYKEFADGQLTLNGTRDRLREFGIESKNGNTVSLSMVHWLLTNPLYYGVIKHNKEFHQGKFEPLISRKTYEAVQLSLADNSNPRKSKQRHDFGFMGLLKCDECGCCITAQFAKGNGGTYRYYRCTKRKVKCTQGYLREDIVINQLIDQLKFIALPKGWASEMHTQVSKWEKEDQQAIILFAQNLEGSIKETEGKLDKLVNSFLEGLIDKVVYLKKKEELINKKRSLADQKQSFGQKGLLWIEPLRNFIDTADRKGLLNSQSQMGDIRATLEKSGTSRVLRDKKIYFDFKQPYSDINKEKAFAGMGENNGVKNKTGKSANTADIPVWWTSRTKSRTNY